MNSVSLKVQEEVGWGEGGVTGMFGMIESEYIKTH